MSALPVSIQDVEAAAARIAPYIFTTPVLTSERLDEMLGCRVFFKCENLQRAGSFKNRGAHNAVFASGEAVAKSGVTTHSSGNHASAVCRAARNRGIPAIVVMPSNAPATKIALVRHYGGEIRFCEPTAAAREAGVAAVIAERGSVFIHPFENPLVIAGQGTAMLEFLNQAPDIDTILAPVGGGGLMSGTSIVARALRPSIRICATEPQQADEAFRSWSQGVWTAGDPPNTIADGLRTPLGKNPFEILRARLDDFVTVREESIIQAMRLLWDTLKIVVEPSSVVPVAALLEERLNVRGRAIGVILTGGNTDLDRLPWQPA